MEEESLTLSPNNDRLRLPKYIDLNEPPVEIDTEFRQEVVDLSKDDNENVNLCEDPDNSIGLQFFDSTETQGAITNENSFDPFIGQCFQSEQEAYAFYENYAKRCGFSIRRGRFITNKDGEIIRRDFFCHREGFPVKKLVNPSKDQRSRESLRCGCKAVMRIKLKRSFEIFPKEWHVVGFVSQHNHNLLPPELVRFLPAYRIISEEDKNRILLYKEAGLSIRQIMRVMELEKNLKHGDLSFFHKDMNNFFMKLRQDHKENDATYLLEHCKRAKDENLNFQYAYTVDKHGRLEHIFWSPAHCFERYQLFGDAVAFDTTYKANCYDMPFAIFVGINNHGRSTLFGCALIRNEAVATFRWLMNAFIKLMKKPPQTIITDQDPWMAQAIASEMPLTKHTFCIWHITSKFSGWITSVLRDQYYNWCGEFYRLYRLDRIEDFEREWPRTISKFNLQKNKHVIGLYEVRQFWVPSYLRGHFFGGMTTTGRSKSINSFVKLFISSRLCLTQLIKQVNLAIENVGQTQLHHAMLDMYRGSSLRTLSLLEFQVYEVFTKFAFKRFQEEFERATHYTVKTQNEVIFMVQHFKETKSQTHQVLWDGDMASCSCKLFEFWGIICHHILTVFLHKNCFEIPSKYLPLRWCRNEFLKDGTAQVLGEEVSRYEGSTTEVGVSTRDTIQCPPISITKGRPRSKRMRGGKELMKQVKTCSFCKKAGHNVTTCSEKENSNPMCVSMNAKKKKSRQEAGDLNLIFSLKF